MTIAAVGKTRPRFRSIRLASAAAGLTGLVFLTMSQSGALGSFDSVRLHAPRFELLATASMAIQLHVAAAAVAFLLGAVLLLGPKGTLPHRRLGWLWAVAMATVAVSSLFIREVNHGAFSLIHLLSGWTIVALPAAIYFARRHKVRVHRKMMSGLYFGGMFVAGGLTFLPGRLMWVVFFG